jgi:hypothetical protein
MQDFGSRVGVSDDPLEEAAAAGLWGSSDPLSETPERALDKHFMLQVRLWGRCRAACLQGAECGKGIRLLCSG